MNTDLVEYYKERAREYEKVYKKPERKADLHLLKYFMKKVFKNLNVFEIACGTGFWTEIIATAANSVYATDINDSVIEIAKTKTYHPAPVKFMNENIFDLQNPVKYENLFGGFIMSHIELQNLDNFINIINNCVVPGGIVVFIDNNYVEGSNLPLSETDANGNTYQLRHLENGTTHKVLKNFLSEESIRQLVNNKAENIHFLNLKHYWMLAYKTMINDQ
jgi:2-polyprenyl-3-methyl-5-hydroxy-6-metoxy-1,4-benzoquinol methylase